MNKPKAQCVVEYIKPTYHEGGRFDCLIAKVNFNVIREGFDTRGDNLHIHVQLPAGAESTSFEKLEALAVKTALELLASAGTLTLEDL